MPGTLQLPELPKQAHRGGETGVHQGVCEAGSQRSEPPTLEVHLRDRSQDLVPDQSHLPAALDTERAGHRDLLRRPHQCLDTPLRQQEPCRLRHRHCHRTPVPGRNGARDRQLLGVQLRRGAAAQHRPPARGL